MEDNGFSVQAVTAAIAGDKEGFLNAFNNAIANKITDALEVKKVEIASNLLGVQDEIQTSQTELDGSADVSTDTSAEVAATAEV
jgi:hypothetical protein